MGDIREQGMEANISVKCMSVYETSKEILLENNAKFDAAYFSGSFSLLPDPVLALKQISQHNVKSGGRIYITQTFQAINEHNNGNKNSSLIISYVKPLMKYLTTIDFGYLINQKHILELYDKSGLEILHHDIIQGSVNNKYQAAFLTILKVP